MKNSTCRHCGEAIHIGLSGNVACWFHEGNKKDCSAEPNYEIKSLTSFELDFLVSEAWKVYKRLYPKIAIRAPGYWDAFDEFERVKAILRLAATLKENALPTEKKDSQMEAITHSLLSKAASSYGDAKVVNADDKGAILKALDLLHQHFDGKKILECSTCSESL